MPGPNVVLLLADDMGFGDVGTFNEHSRIPTPHMDRLAADGMVFTDAHSPSAVCTPSRYGILTGRYCWRTELTAGVFGGYEPPLIEPGRPTLASVLREAGYRTGAFGKWHVGLGYTHLDGTPVKARPYPWGAPSQDFEATIDFEARIRGGPTELGFDEFFGTSGCPTCQTPYAWIEDDRFVDPPSVYQTDHPYTGRPGMRSASWDDASVDTTVIERTVRFIRENTGSPFFAYVALSAPHEPCVDEFVPEFARGQSDAGPRGDLVWLVDHAAGRIDAALRAAGVADDTIFVVTSDNGALAGDRVLDDRGVETYRTYGHRSSGPWRGHKAHIWEGGHREPLILRWPSRIPPGSENRNLMCLTDLPTTIASMVGARFPRAAADDGFDLAAAVLEDSPWPREHAIHHSQRGVFAVRSGRWKAIFGTKGSGGWPPPSGGPPGDESVGQLYDLDADPAETTDLWDERQDVVAGLRSLLDDVRKDGRAARSQISG